MNKMMKYVTLFLVLFMMFMPGIYSSNAVHAGERVKIENKVEQNVDTTAVKDNVYITGYLDSNNKLQFYTHVGQDRSLTALIAVWVGGTIVAYLTASVIDGIVIAATGKSGGEWVATAIKYVVGRRYTGEIHLPVSGPYTCPGVVIDHSGMCPS
ncbi:hypothetical protein [Streptococcus sp. Marseille-P8640]|uniref:hypothetical protein n=1 Tax=Streptococcus sp. Marseille-P8640 TaxID=2866596 RepID=UPI0023B944F4|nr:hypothetical protein [Streptococcus sp. Marseille-P8640]MCT7839552.1 hypothetical protein [Lactobacillus iners]MCT7848363.1 hypothetical protein [Lactobacillus iners]